MGGTHIIPWKGSPLNLEAAAGFSGGCSCSAAPYACPLHWHTFSVAGQSQTFLEQERAGPHFRSYICVTRDLPRPKPLVTLSTSNTRKASGLGFQIPLIHGTPGFATTRLQRRRVLHYDPALHV